MTVSNVQIGILGGFFVIGLVGFQFMGEILYTKAHVDNKNNFIKKTGKF